jgi:hypothetical protein
MRRVRSALSWIRVHNRECAIFALIFTIYGHFASFGTWDFFENDSAGRGAAYDSMAESFKHLDVTVDPSIITSEAFIVKGKVHMYFGPWPSMVRLIWNGLLPGLWGRWARFSVLVAGMLSVIALFLLLSDALERNGALTLRERRFWKVAGTTAFAFASPMFFLISSSSIYHEAILWGLAGSLWALRLHGVASSIAGGVSILSRVTFGIPWVIGKALSFRGSKRSWFKIMLPILIAIGIQAVVNDLRFGSPFVFQDLKTYTGITDHVNSPYILQGNFNVRRIPETLGTYFGFSEDSFSSKFPFVRLTSHEPAKRELFAYWEPVLSLWVGSTALLVLSIGGLIYFLRRPKEDGDRVLFAGFLLQAALIFCFVTISQRYLGDVLPLLVFLMVKLFGEAQILRRPGFKVFVSLLILINIGATIFSTYAWTGEYWWATPPERRAEIQAFIQSF